MANNPTPFAPDRLLSDLGEKIRRVEAANTLANASTQGATTWQDSTGVAQIVIGSQSDGTYAIWIGQPPNQMKIVATGPNAGKIVGLVISSIAGNLSVGGTLTAGAISTGGTLNVTGQSTVQGLAAYGDISGATISTGGSKYTITNTGNSRLDITTH